MNRRDFIKDAVMVSAVAAAFPLRAEISAALGQNPAISAVLYDDRYEDCRMFAESLAGRGAMAVPTDGDAARVWYGALRGHLKRLPGAIAGMTTDSDWGLSRGCGREVGLNVSYEGSHDSRISGVISHLVRGCGLEKDVYAALLKGEVPWTAAIADALTRSASKADRMDCAERLSILATPRSEDPPHYLTSWLLQYS